MHFFSGTKRCVCKSADSGVCVREERDGARDIGKRAVRVSGGAGRWQRRPQGDVCVRGARCCWPGSVNLNLFFWVRCLFRDHGAMCVSDTRCVYFFISLNGKRITETLESGGCVR